MEEISLIGPSLPKDVDREWEAAEAYAWTASGSCGTEVALTSLREHRSGFWVSFSFLSLIKLLSLSGTGFVVPRPLRFKLKDHDS